LFCELVADGWYGDELMAETAIEWTHRRLLDGSILPGFTFNVVWGCTKVSEGCKHCYADTLASRYGFSLWGLHAERRIFGDEYWRRPLLWNALAERLGHRLNVFCSSMADVFEDHWIVMQECRKLWPLIEQTPMLDWLLLTKRPQNILHMVPWPRGFPGNVWIGTSVENQRRADERVPALLEVPAVVRFLSCEPLLGPVDLSAWLPSLQWVIVGGESGPGARPMASEWVCSLRDACVAENVPFFFKQWGGRTSKSGGRLLDGREWNEMPPEKSSEGK
jgi:protein gp37